MRARTLSIFIYCAAILSAGVQYPAKPGETVVAGQYVVRLKPGAASTVISWYAPIASIIPLHALNLHVLRFPAGQSAAAMQAIVNSLAGDTLVQYVEPDRVRKLSLAAPNDAAYTNPGSQWDLLPGTGVDALGAWNALPNLSYLTGSTANPARIPVADIDTGADCTHPDFINAGGSSADAALGGQLLFGASLTNIQTTVKSPACAWQDDHGHGTHTAGTIAAATNNNMFPSFNGGVASLGFPLQLVIYKGLAGDGTGSDSGLANEIMQAADAGIHVISASWGDTGYSQVLQDAVTYAWQRNTLFVTAAGNGGNSNLFFPAGATYAIGVAATDSGGNRAGFSNNGDYVRVAGPGVNIYSTMPTYPTTIGTSPAYINYGNLSGTSMATPHVAALAGLLWMQTPNASAAAVMQRIEQTASFGNLAHGKPATQSSGALGSPPQGLASNAVDGNTDGNYADGSVSQTLQESTPWWQVDLGASAFIHSIVIWNRTDCCSDRLSDYWVFVSNTPFLATDTPVTLQGRAGTWSNHQTSYPNSSTTIPVTAQGRYVRVQLSGYNYLSLAEVQVFGDGDGDFGYGIINANSAVSDNLRPASPGGLTGQVVDTQGNLIAAQLTVNGPTSASVTADSNGRYRIANLPSGTYQVLLSASGYTMQTLSATIAAGTDTILPVTMGVTYGSVSGNVAGAPASGAIVQALSSGLIVATTVTDSTGNYTLSVVPGTYDITASTLGFNPATVPAQSVLANTTTFVSLAITQPENAVPVTIMTNPPGLSIVVDGVTYTAPHFFAWTQGSQHTLDTQATQGNTSTRYLLLGWSNNVVSHNQTVVVSAASYYTANFKTQYLLTTTATPTNEGSIAPVTGFVDSGTPVAVSAAAFTGYQFNGFSGDLGGTTNPQTLTMLAPHAVTANFSPPAVTVVTSPPGLSIVVDNVTYTAPQVFVWTMGSPHKIDTIATQGSGTTRYVFTGWANTGSTAPQSLQMSGTATYTANFKTQYQLTTAVTPSSGGGITPASGFVDATTPVTITATPANGYTFSGFTGDLTGAANPQVLTMLAAHSVTANFVSSTAADLAVGMAATQSSTLVGFGPAGAANAVDGKTDGNFNDGSVAHTNQETNAWWQVDLGASASIGSIAIWNRTDCCSERLSDYWIFVSNTPFLSTDTPATLQGRAGTWSNHQTTYPNPSTTIAVNAVGRYVRVQLSGYNYLMLAEVQIFGASTAITTYSISGQVTLSGNGLNGVNMTLSGTQASAATTSGSGNYSFSSLPASGVYTVTPILSGYNFNPPSQTINNLSSNQIANFIATAVSSNDLAIGKPATQSSTLAGFGPTAVASSAVDGNTDGNFNDGSVSHTNNETNAWWQVDLGSSASIGSIAIWNRTDCCMDRLSDYWIFVSNTPFAASDTPLTLQGRAGTWSSHQTSYPNPSTTIPVNSVGRYVRVQLNGANYLALAEVQVFGSSAPPLTYGISGQVTSSGAALGGVTMTLSGTQGGSATTGASGTYSFTSVAANGTYTVTPSLSGYTFSPTSQSFFNLGANQVANFTAFAVTNSDLALGRPATQSSTLAGFGPTAVASSAVDGNTDGNFFDGSVSHTNFETTPWWQVDLGTSSTISSIVIWNRTDCCNTRLSDYWVFVSNTPFLSTDTPATLQGRAGTWNNHQTTYPNPSSTIAVNAAGRYVRVQLSGTDYLNLAEVQVFGASSPPVMFPITGQVTLSGAGLSGVTMTVSGSQTGTAITTGSGNYGFSLPAGGTYTVTPSLSGYSFTPPSQTFTSLSASQTFNFTATASTTSDLAVGKPASQSSTLAGFGPSTVAQSAVDGNTDGNFYDGSVSHTNNEEYAWWQVDLGASATISSIVIWNRTDCCGDRLGDYWVFVSNTPFSSTDTPPTLSSEAGVWSNRQMGVPPNPSTTIPVNTTGRYVRVQLNGANYLNLAEVQVFGH